MSGYNLGMCLVCLHRIESPYKFLTSWPLWSKLSSFDIYICLDSLKYVGNLMEKVEKYNGGNRQDKEYIYLDEMLTRNLLKLDDIETEGKEDVRAARKQAIRQIQRCISQLESKAPTGEKTNTDDTQPIESNQASTEQAENSQPSGQTTESKGSS